MSRTDKDLPSRLLYELLDEDKNIYKRERKSRKKHARLLNNQGRCQSSCKCLIEVNTRATEKSVWRKEVLMSFSL